MLGMKAGEIASVLGGTLISGSPDSLVNAITIDSRSAAQGVAFVAFEGEKVDGHKFVESASQAGASAIIVTRPIAVSSGQTAVILVENALKAVQQLAIHERASFQHPVIGVTGSNGKTTTKDMLRTVFDVGGSCLATLANLNTELGLPLTILRLEEAHTSMVLEMGMRGLGQIRDLCDIARPTSGIITNIGQSHIELLGSQAAIAEAKGELVESLPESGVVALWYEDPWQHEIAKKAKAKVLWYGLTEQADAFATDIVSTDAGLEFTAHVLGEEVTVLLPTFGRHNVVNALGALLLGAANGLPLGKIAVALKSLPAAAGRLRITTGVRNQTVIDDCYNASPLSVRASLQVLAEIGKRGTKIAVLGDMYELGTFEEEAHRDVGRACVEMGVDRLVAIGPKSHWIADEARQRSQTASETGSGDGRIEHPMEIFHFEEKAEALLNLDSLITEESTVLVKASRGMKLEDIVSRLEKGSA